MSWVEGTGLISDSLRRLLQSVMAKRLQIAPGFLVTSTPGLLYG